MRALRTGSSSQVLGMGGRGLPSGAPAWRGAPGALATGACLSRRGLVAAAGLMAGTALLAATGCVDQHPEDHGSAAGGSTKAVADMKIVATSPACVDICDKLEMKLVGVPKSNLEATPDRYKDATKVGMAMSPDMEILKSLAPDYVISPVSLISDLKPKYAAARLASIFLNLNSVEGMYASIADLGRKFECEKQANALVAEYDSYMKGYREENKGKDAPTCLVLMGLPGSYVVATEYSYVGSLVKLAGGKNVYAGQTRMFLNANTEDMKAKKPDVILRAAHALPEQVTEMFNKDFKENDIWQHFEAVQEGRVYDLPYDQFGMSAKFNYPDALKTLQPILYGGD